MKLIRIRDKLTLTHVGCIQWLVPWSVEFRLAEMAVDALGVVLAVLTDTTAFVIAVNVQRQVLLVGFRIVGAFVRVAEAVAGCNVIHNQICYRKCDEHFFYSISFNRLKIVV